MERDVRLPQPLERARAAFERHLRSERGLSAHTVRAYLGDVDGLLQHAADQGCAGPADVDIDVLRGWLAGQHRAGQARATVARRAAAARSFTAFAHRQGWLAVDPGVKLGAPKVHKRLPQVLAPDQMARVLTERATQPEDELAAAIAVRDTAIMEVLYAAGIRVSELCGLDAADLDDGRRTVRVLGKGSKERVVPVGIPAARAVAAWLASGRPVVARRPVRSGHCSSARAEPASTRGRCAAWCTPGSRPRGQTAPGPGCPTPGRTDCGTRPPPTCWRVALTCAACRKSSATPRWRPPRSTRTSAWSAWWRCTTRPTRGHSAGYQVSAAGRGRRPGM